MKDMQKVMARRSGAYDVEIGKRIRAQRLSRGMSQEDLADRLGVTFQQLQKYEKGANRVSAARLREIAIALKLPISVLYGTDRYASKAGAGNAGVQELITSSRAINLLKHFSRIKDAAAQNLVVDLCERLADKG
jgi:transcriptional regulator with XRE-family HTH domain